MDTDIINMKTDDTYKDIAEDVETRFDTSQIINQTNHGLKEKVKK